MIPVEETRLPRYVKYRGRRVRVIGYTPKTSELPARFRVIDTRDAERDLRRNDITFIKTRRSKT